MAIGTTAAIIGGLIGAGGSIAGSAINARGAGNAARTQQQGVAEAQRWINDYLTRGEGALTGALPGAIEDYNAGTNSANATLRSLLDSYQGQLQPYQGAGVNALNQIQEMLDAENASGGLREMLAQFQRRGPFSFGNQDFIEDPGYQFRMAEGQKALDRAAAARGMFGSGQAVKDLMRFNQGFASNEFNNAFSRALQGYQANANRDLGGINATISANQARAGQLGQLLNAGQTATGQNIQLGSLVNSQIAQNQQQAGQFGANARLGLAQALAGLYGSGANSMAGLATQGANAAAAGQVAGANAWGQGIGGAANSVLQSILLRQLFGGGGNQPGNGRGTV